MKIPGITKAWKVYPRSVQKAGAGFVFFARGKEGKRLLSSPAAAGEKFEGVTQGGLKVCPLTPANAAALRARFPFTSPVAGGYRTSFGTGDRVGLAGAGHVRALQRFKVFPILAQQSMRELSRTGRVPQDVIDSATFAVFQEGYTDGYGADADHVKTIEDAVRCLKTGFTMFTIDAADFINRQGVKLSDGEALQALNAAPNAEALRVEYVEQGPVVLKEGKRSLTIQFSEGDLGRAVAVYGKAVAHMTALYGALKDAAGSGAQFDFEVSIDETDTDTLPRDHYFVASELKRAGVVVQSLAPKFVGQFQKGIDYIGDKKIFERQFAEHCLIAKHLGNYKISVHSGSDKFSIFPIIGRVSKGYFHGKTAGTSWLEAVRVAAAKAPALYQKMHALALSRFEEDRKSYHVTTNLDAIPSLERLKPRDLPKLLDKVDSRQLLHITYGSLLQSYRSELFPLLDRFEEDHYKFIEKLMVKHLESLKVPRRKS